MTSRKTPSHILPTLVLAQFAGTSLWFAGNAILVNGQGPWDLPSRAPASITTAVMFGFITGTFIFALLSIADRFRPSRVFFVCALLGAVTNTATTLLPPSYLVLLFSRFLTGFFIAGIYPVGMKIASDWFAGKLGKALGYLIGALVLGTAFPHLLSYTGSSFSWKYVLTTTSVMAASGGLLILFLVGDGPYRTQGYAFSPGKIITIFKTKDFRAAAFGYFGHMWELYSFWAFIPVILAYYKEIHSGSSIDISLWSFIIIGTGAVACILGGIGSVRYGSAKVAFSFLLISGICCLLSPVFFQAPPALFLFLLLVWGLAVIGDSAQFSSLNAQTAPREFVGTALTITVSIGFFITIPSIQLLSLLEPLIGTRWILFTLLLGPLFGLSYMKRLNRRVERGLK